VLLLVLNYIVTANNTNICKHILDAYWQNQDIWSSCSITRNRKSQWSI